MSQAGIQEGDAPPIGRTRRPSPRLFGVDLARGVAIVGMLWVHVAPDGPGWTVADGRSAILFATLAGVSLGLLTGGPNPPPRGLRWPSYRTIAIRGLLLILLGRWLVLFGTPIAVILDYYGVLFLVLLVVLFAPRWVQAIVVLLALTVGAWLVQVAGPDPGAAFQSRDPLEWPGQWLLTGLYPIALYAAFVAAGLVAARSDLARRRTQVVMLAGGLVVAPLGYLGGALLGVDAGPHANTAWEAVGSGALAIAAIGFLQLLGGLRVVRRVLSPLADMGSMPLTIYTAQVLVAAAFLAAHRGTRYDIQEWWLLAAIVGGSLLFATVWRRLVGRGPLETVLAFLSRASRTIDGQPIRADSVAAASRKPSRSRLLAVLGTGLVAGAAGAVAVLALSLLYPGAALPGTSAADGGAVTGSTIPAVGGAARLTFDGDELADAGIEVGATGSGQALGPSVVLPVVGGEVTVGDSRTGGALALDGALTFSANGHTALLEHLVVDLDAGTGAGDLSVDDTAVSSAALLFTFLATPPPSLSNAWSVSVEEVAIVLSPDTVAAVNGGLGTYDYGEGVEVGRMSLSVSGP